MGILIVFLGGMVGGMCRYVLARAPQWGGIPVGTLAANTIACGILGMVTQAELTALWQFFLGVGVAGALSTWSTLAKELGDMLIDRLYMRFAIYLGITLLSGVCATGFGSWLA